MRAAALRIADTNPCVRFCWGVLCGFVVLLGIQFQIKTRVVLFVKSRHSKKMRRKYIKYFHYN